MVMNYYRKKFYYLIMTKIYLYPFCHLRAVLWFDQCLTWGHNIRIAWTSAWTIQIVWFQLRSHSATLSDSLISCKSTLSKTIIQATVNRVRVIIFDQINVCHNVPDVLGHLLWEVLMSYNSYFTIQTVVS